MSLTFNQILEHELGTRGETTVPARTATLFESKALDLKGTIQVRMESEIDAEDIEQHAMDAAARRVDDILENIISEDVLKDKAFTQTSRTRRRGVVDIPTKATGLRGKDGRFLSAFNLSRLLNLVLYSHVQRFMKKPKLVNRTGRFAHSAHITGIEARKKLERERKNRVSIAFSYMTTPYAVFEEDSNRDPRKLIKMAINSALKSVLSPASYSTNIFNIEDS